MILGQTASRVEPIPVPLQGVDYEGIVTAGTAYLTIHQTYVNSFDENLEARYLFPAPASGAIAGFRFRIGSSMCSAELKPREIAVDKYEEAVVQGMGAGLLEQERDDLFTASLGNIPPGESAEIWVQVVLGLEVWPERLRLKIPTYVFPRYVPIEPHRVPDASRIVPDYVEDPGYRASLNLRVDLGYAVEVSSPSHRIGWQIEDNGTRGTVQFLEGPTRLNQDIVLLLVPQKREVESGSRLQIRLGTRTLDDGSRPAAFTLLPDLPERASHLGPQRVRVLFLLDRSGSMTGSSLRSAKELLSALLQELRAGDEFELLAFQSDSEVLFGRLTPFTPASRKAARSYLETINAYGGTELGAALKLAACTYQEVDRLVLLTDAQVGHEAEILRGWSWSNAEKVPPQIFAIGVGANVASGLLERLARETSGWVGELHPNDSVSDLVAEIAWRLVSPTLRIRELQFHGCEVTDFAVSSWALRPGEPWCLWGKVRTSTEASNPKLEIKGRWEDGEEILSVPLDLGSAVEGDETRFLWGHARIRELESLRDSALHEQRRITYSRRIQAVSLESGVLSSETAFVGVLPDPGNRSFQRSMRSLRIPYELLAPAAVRPAFSGSVLRSAVPSSFLTKVSGPARVSVSAVESRATASFHGGFDWPEIYQEGSIESDLVEALGRAWNLGRIRIEELVPDGSMAWLLVQVKAAGCCNLQTIGLALILLALTSGIERGLLQLDSSELKRLERITRAVEARLAQLGPKQYTLDPRGDNDQPLPGLTEGEADLVGQWVGRLAFQGTGEPFEAGLSSRQQDLAGKIRTALAPFLDLLPAS